MVTIMGRSRETVEAELSKSKANEQKLYSDQEKLRNKLLANFELRWKFEDELAAIIAAEKETGK
jgi:hypothetical protein